MIEQDVTVKELNADIIWNVAGSSLPLLNPCEEVANGKTLSSKILMITSSSVVGQAGQYLLIICRDGHQVHAAL